MITLKIVLIGIMTLVPKGGWENPEKIYVLLNKGGDEHCCEPHHTQHNAVLMFNPDHLAVSPGPAAAFLHADRDCSRLPMIAFHPPRAAWLFDGLELTVDQGWSPGKLTERLQTLRCAEFDKPSTSDPDATCTPVDVGSSGWKVRHDIRWLLDIDTLYGSPVPLDPACLATPVGVSCRGALAARLVLDSGLVSTRTLSGESEDEHLRWYFARPADPVDPSATAVTFAGTLQIEIRYPQANAVTLRHRSLGALSSDPVLPSLTLRPRGGEETIVVSVENVPLSERLPVEYSCGSQEPPPPALHHAMLLYELALNPPATDRRRLPIRPTRIAGGGVGEHNPPKCEPPGGAAHP